MNRKIIQKVIDRLTKETPDIQYALGILDTILESLPEEKTVMTFDNVHVGQIPAMIAPVQAESDEGRLLDMEASAKLKAINAMIKYD